MAWRQIDRKTIYTTPFISVHEDTIELHNGKIIDDFSVVEFRNGVVIIATDTDGRLIAIDEYKYAVNKTLRVLPAGGIEEGSTPEDTAIKELQEETGYKGDKVEIIRQFYDHPSKLPHVTYAVRVYNAQRVQEAEHEETESISAVCLMDFTEDTINMFETSVNVSALYTALKK
jgi:ADP-ribose pyrophosphatase